jgi:hypothetical protein
MGQARWNISCAFRPAAASSSGRTRARVGNFSGDLGGVLAALNGLR